MKEEWIVSGKPGVGIVKAVETELAHIDESWMQGLVRWSSPRCCSIVAHQVGLTALQYLQPAATGGSVQGHKEMVVAIAEKRCTCLETGKTSTVAAVAKLVCSRSEIAANSSARKAQHSAVLVSTQNFPDLVEGLHW